MLKRLARASYSLSSERLGVAARSAATSKFLGFNVYFYTEKGLRYQVGSIAIASFLG